MNHTNTSGPGTWVFVTLIATGFPGVNPAFAQEKKPRYPKAPSAANVKTVPEAWASAPHKPLEPGEIDRLLALAHAKDTTAPAPLVNDEQFIRRVRLDLTGRLPTPAEVEEFVKDTDSQKRARLIDRLLASDDYAHYWARYWRDVFLWRATDMRVVIRLPRTYGMEIWLAEQLKSNRSWADITRALLTAEGVMQLRAPTKNGAAAFLLAHAGDDAAVERAADTARVFLGIRIQCAQCHDHPDDIWKRQQFHEMAAFFGRLGDRVTEGEGKDAKERKGAGLELVAKPNGEYQMPDRDDPKKSSTVHPRFLIEEPRPNGEPRPSGSGADGEPRPSGSGHNIPHGLGDRERRRLLADLITSSDNYWYAAAFVNRIWGALMGQGFYQPVDNMGPLLEATDPQVLLRLADGFRATNHDIKGLFRAVMNSQAYQRQFRLAEPRPSGSGSLDLATPYPARLRGDAIWFSLRNLLGPFPGEDENARTFAGGAGVAPSPFAKQAPSLQFRVKQLFDFDPSARADEVEGSVPQAMMLMNNQVLNSRILATGDTPLARLLREHPQDDAAVQIMYLQALSRRPTPRELETCKDYIKEVGKRGEALEDILWTLVNSTEFQTKK